MPNQPIARTIDALRATLVRVEEMAGLSPEDASLLALKNILLQRIADLETESALASATSSAGAADAPAAPDQLPSLSPETTPALE